MLTDLLLRIILATATAAQTPYPKMAPVDQYLMPRDAEITLARSAAPDSISHDASVLVLTAHGFETAVTGSNGWTCLVDRSWAGMLDHPEFWNPRIRAAACLNPAASRSVIPFDRLRAQLVLAGHSKEEIVAATAAALSRHELPAAIEPGAMCYMMSPTNYLSDQGATMAHVMFYTPDDGKPWGVNAPGSPIFGVSLWAMDLSSFPQLASFPRIFVSLIPVNHFSDGSPAMKM